ncbi:YDG domain-containing protein [Agriterribacter sp.]|uniref:YDG domain-containing protein n=1 Tax=Agriterribacter sp. TaxID=2821509 RepID=UPI002B7B0B70|nr:YDG domain-containing protein [Agriterribacter sp.]HTN06948.1 YDG domain-containing protein [Agriterribacter sp.]
MNNLYPTRSSYGLLYACISKLSSKSKIALIFLLAIIMYKASVAQTTLSAGDIAVVRINEDGTDGFSLVNHVPVSAGTSNYRAYAINSGGTSYGTTTAVPGALLSTNPVISFSNNSGFSDNVASDGEGGSIAISDFDINVLPINSGGSKLTADPIEYHDETQPGWSGYPAIITYGSSNAHYGWSVRSGNGAEFNLKAIDAHDWGNWEGGTTFVLEAFRDGASLGSITFSGNTSGTYVQLREEDQLSAIFKNVDEVRMYQQGGINSYITVNNIQVGPASASPPPAITANPPNRTVCALSNTTFSVTATNATGYQWQQNTGSGFSNISNGGVYSGATTSTLSLAGITAGMSSNQYRCVASGSGTATSNAGTLTVSNISAAFGQTNIACYGASTGSVTVTPSGGISPYSYSWSPSGGTAATASGLAAGSYTVTITDNTTCTATKNFTISQPAAALSATISATNVSCNGGSNGTASVAVSGGTPDYTYSWSPSGGTGAIASGLAVGTYTCTITDANSCQVIKSVTINQPTALSATASKTDVSCYMGSNGTASVSVSGGTAPYSYSWSPSGGTAATASGLTAGTYTVTVTDNNTCQTTRSVTVSQPSALTATASKTDVSCYMGSNGTASVGVSGGTAPYSYSWSPSGGTAATASGLAVGTYTVTVTDNNTCQTTRSVTVTQPASITAVATPASETICSGGSTDIALTSSSSGAGFSWTVTTVSGSVSGTSASSGSSIQQTLTGSGVVKYTIIPNNGLCSGASKDILVTVNALTTIALHPSGKAIDEEESTSFSIEANNASSYQWQVDAGSGFTNISNNSYYSGAATATLTISNALGGMDGYHYRCVATGNCAPVNSNRAQLSVRVRTAQTISFASTQEKVYGAADFIPAATSDAGLEISYSSSNESIASVTDGKVHIKNAGQVTITATQAGNNDYKPAAPVQQVLTIAKKQITVSLNASPAISKAYDGYTGIELAAGNYALQGSVEGDDVYVTGTASFEDGNAGGDKDIHVSSFILNGEDMDNYELTTNTAEVKGTITRKAIEISLHSTPSISKAYNGSDEADLVAANYSLSGVVGEDDVIVASGKASYNNNKAGYDKEITVTAFVLGGEQKDNYSVSTVSANTRGDIIAKDITLSLLAEPAISKIYDGSVEATVPTEKYQLEGVEEGDKVSVKGTAVYDNRHAGDDKTVSINTFVLQGDDRNNYHLTTTEATAPGSIKKATLKVELLATPAITKAYDGNTGAVLLPGNYSVEGIAGDDYVVINYPVAGVYETKHGGEGKKVTVNGLQITGEDADNYSLESTTVSGNVGAIAKKLIEVTAISQTKVYGEADPELTYVAEGKLEGDQLPGSLQRTAGKNVGSYEIEQGSLNGGDDYEIESFGTAAFTIAPAPLLIKSEDKTKKQGATNPVFTFSYDGLAEGDQPSDLEVQPSAATNATTGSPIGYYDIEASGAASGNYTISYTKGKLTVTPANNANYSVKVWSSSPNTLTVKIYTTVAQKAAIILYTETGQQVILQQQQLNAGINSFNVSVAHLASSTYVLGVTAEIFRDAQKVKVK